jgi:excisionase family DNA binding protein
LEDQTPQKVGAEVSHERLDLADRLALRPAEAARALGISERTLRSLLPQLPVVRAGGAVLIPVDALRGWLRDRARNGQDEVNEAVRDALKKVNERLVIS